MADNLYSMACVNVEPQSLLGVLQKSYIMLSYSEVPLTIGGFLRARISAAAMQFGARLTNAATTLQAPLLWASLIACVVCVPALAHGVTAKT
jgi:hypothetical protein